MDDDFGFGASVWATPSEPIIVPSSSKLPLPIISVPSVDSFDDFDDFGTPAETPTAEQTDDEDFGDFGDFGEVADAAISADFGEEAGFGEEVRILKPYKTDWEPLRLDPMPSRADLETQVNDILAPIYGSDDISKVTTADGIREVGGIGQILMTSESRELYNRLVQGPAPTKPPNWTRSRIRRQHLIALGIPVNLDQVLPRTSGKPLPTLNISTRPMSAPPVQRAFINHGPATSNLAPTSRPGTPQNRTRPPASASVFGPKPELDETKIAELLDLDLDTLPLLPLATLEHYMTELRLQTVNTSTLLTHLLQTRESLQQDSETYNKLIGELVGEAQKVKTARDERLKNSRKFESVAASVASMNIAHSLPSTVSGISFSFLTSQDIRRISVKQIVNPVLLDDLNRPNVGGLYDPALGPSDKQDICATCRLTYFTCPGHFGHIDLPAPVFHPLFMTNMYNLLRGICLYCHRFKIRRNALCKYIAKLRLLEHGLLDAAQGVDDIHQRVSMPQRGNDDQEETVDETDSSFQLRINLYVMVHLSRASGSKRDHYKDSLVYQARKDLIADFLKATILKKCFNQGCHAHGPTFRKEGYTKVIELELARKQKLQNSASGQKRPDVLLYQKMDSLVLGGSNEIQNGSDPDEQMSGSGSEGEPVNSDEESDHEKPPSPQIPKTASGKAKSSRGRNERVMTPEECRAHLRRLFQKEAVACSVLFGRHGPFAPLSPDGLSFASADMFFMEVIPVAPTRFRPPAKLGDVLFEHPQNELLAKVLNTSYRLRDLNVELRSASLKTGMLDKDTRRKILGTLFDALVQLQINVNSFMDSSKNPAPIRAGKLPPAGVKQGLEKKEGLFRKHMMGKRVNYAARSVISPDVNIEPNEIGIPPVFARKLTFPEPVTPANFHELRQWVITGPRGYPGATLVEYEDGHQQSLDGLSVEQRTAIANQLLTPQEGDRLSSGRLSTRTTSVNKKVYRHLQDGDILILNRQPTLHKPSMMAHKARVLRGEKTIRMHYANCNSYNADFDGDEMNIHFPQNQVARAEATFIANTDNQYLVPTSGKPLRGLIQDHVVAGVWMTSQDAFFTRDDYFQLLYGALRPEEDSCCSGTLVTLPPAIWKPRPLWTGKQIISTVLKNITPSNAEGVNLEAKAKVPGHLWGNDSMEDKVLFMDGELLCGILDKSAFGATDFGLVHSVYELYGADIAGKLLGILSRLFTKFLQHRGFTCRMDDLALTPDGNARRRVILQLGASLGTEGAIENFPSLSDTPQSEIPATLRSLLEDVLRDDNKMAGLDVTVKTKLAKLTKKIADVCMPHGLLRKFPHNHMQTMTLSGAKGSAVNAQQISCALGQQELEGRRVPVMVSGKTLPSFKPFETKAIAGGYVASRFLTGVKPQEFYFHCMAGREGLIDTAVKTSRSGYLQRCLIKHLEGIRVHYDHTVRGSDSSIYQFNYGGDALDVTKQTHLYQFEFFARNHVSALSRYSPRSIFGFVNEDEALEYMKKTIKRSASPPDKHTPSKRDKYMPALSKYSPSRYLGSTSEKFAEEVDRYVKSNRDKLLKFKGTEETVFKRRRPLIPSKHFRLLMNVKYMRSLVEPGEAVGLLASQGVGEPSTQMTLNTFHFAGHGAANVTLGIPRLREIVMTASQKPKTPSMTMEVCSDISLGDVDTFCKRASRITLSQVVDKVTVTERLAVTGDARRTQFTVDIAFFPKEELEAEYDVDLSQILAAFAVKFPLLLKKEMLTEMKKLDADLRKQIAELGKGQKVRGGAGEGDGDDEGDAEAPGRKKDDDEQSEVGDGDAEDSKRARQKKQMASYESDDDDADEAVEPFDDAAIEAEYASQVEDDPEEEGNQSKTSMSENLKKQAQAVESLFLGNFPQATMFHFLESGCTFQIEMGADMPKLLLVGMIEQTCRKTIIRQIPGITECFRVKNDDSEKIRLTTNGSNFHGMWEFTASAEKSIIEDHGIYSNDIFSILKTYGVEMARAAILREIGGVFGAYKIDVNIRHLELIADYMTFDGGYKPFNRKGLSSNPSPLLKASYETTGAFLSDATLYGDFDDLTTPSGNIVMGRPNLTGTGVFDVVMPTEKG